MTNKKKKNGELVSSDTPYTKDALTLDAGTRSPRLTPRLLKTRGAGLVLIAVYLLLGLFIVKDYGISFDEYYERETSLVAYNYVMRLEHSQSESVREFAKTIPSFDVYPEKHGTALHFPLVAVEHMFDFQLPTQTVYLMRHVFNFLNYILAALCFYAIIWRRFPKTYIPFLGALLFILYPRFFAEAFYNNKDILFYSWYIISIYAVLRWMEKPYVRITLIAGAVLALAANTRILALSVLLLAVSFYIVRTVLDKKRGLKAALPPVLLAVAFFVVYTAITPHTWHNPFTGFVEVFMHFLRFSPWDGRQLYLGHWITREVPWHYIPVWIGVSSPLLYTVLFIIGNVAYVAVSARGREKLRGVFCTNMCDSFFVALFWCTLIGFIGLGIHMYNGWRHAYAIFCPLLYIAIYGLNASGVFLLAKRKFVMYTASVAAVASVLLMAVWIAANHPYQYVYFNPLAAPYAKENFDRDYWGVSGGASLKYMLETDLREYITVSPPHPSAWYMLSEQEQKRAVWLENPFSWADFHFTPEVRPEHPYSPDYIVPYIHGNIIPEIPGYQVVSDIESGGVTLSRLYKNMAVDAFDDTASKNIRFVSGTAGNGDYAAMFDGSPDTFWTTNAPQKEGDYIEIEFNNPVLYNFFRLDVGNRLSDYVLGRILVSVDGVSWTEADILWQNCVDYLISSPPYRYLRIVNGIPDGNYWWSVCELRFGNADPDWYQ